jgi:hypothetical protein
MKFAVGIFGDTSVHRLHFAFEFFRVECGEGGHKHLLQQWDALHLKDLLVKPGKLLGIKRHNCKMSDLRLRHPVLPYSLVTH